MKRQLILFFAILILGWSALIWLPWWTTIVLAFLLTLLLQKGRLRHTFWIAGLAGALVWMAMSAKIDLYNHRILSQKIAILFHLPSSYLLWLVEGIIGFISAGLGAWTANSLKKQ